MIEPSTKLAPLAPHEPKIAALSAYAEKVLSPDGSARVQRHLERCDPCRRALASIDLYRSTSAEIRTADVPAIEWSRIELALAREARAVAAEARATSDGARADESGEHATTRDRVTERARSSVPGVAWIGFAALAAAAAVMLVIQVWPSDVTIADRADARDEPVVAPEPPATIEGVVTLAAGTAIASSPHGETLEERTLTVGDAIAEGTRIVTAAASEAHVRLADGTGVIALADTALAMTQLREDVIEVALDRGRLATSVGSIGAPSTGAPALGGPALAGGSRFVVLAEAYRFEATTTRFEVSLEPNVVRLAVHDGTVAVHWPDGRVEHVAAPATWTSAGDAAAAVTEPGSTPRGLDSSSDAEPVLSVTHPDIVRWEIAGAPFVGAGSIAMRVPAGEIAIAGYDANGRAFRALVVVGSDGLQLGSSELVAEPPRVSEGFLRIEDIQDVARRGRPSLQRCFEQALRVSRDDLAPRIMVTITVGLDGSVTRTRLTGGETLPPAFQECVRTQIERWSFPSPVGGTVTFSAPFSFSAH